MIGILELLRESGALLEGHFLLSSGCHSDKYFQCARLIQYPDKTTIALSPLASRIKADIRSALIVVDAIAGPAMGGIIPAWELGRQLGLRSIFTERDGNNEMSLRRGFEVKPGEHVLIVEDVITTGKSYNECALALQNNGAIISALACVVDRRPADSLAENVPAWPLYAGCRMEANIWEPDSCELCKRKIPLEKPGSRLYFRRTSGQAP